MLLNNPFQMSDWKFGQFISSVIIIQFLTLILVGLNLNGIKIPIITQLICFIYLTFIPGFLILRILKIHNIGNIKSLFYSVGLSIVSIYFIGFTMNMLLPVFGISKPISIIPLIVIVSFYVLILSILSFIRDRDFSSPSFIDTKYLSSPLILFLCLIPFLAIFGSYSMNFWNSNLLSMLLIVLIAFIVLLMVFDKIPSKLYPFAIWIIAISLIYDSSLISTYIWGWDIQNEYYLANKVISFSIWDPTYPDAYNAMLSVVMLAPFYSIISNMDLAYVFKIIYPLLFSLVPVGLYKIFKNQSEPKIAFLACFLFVSFYTFFIEMLSLAREMIAELFLIMLLLLIFDKVINKRTIILSIIFSIGLIISHYSLTYLAIFSFTGVLITLFLINMVINYLNGNKSSLNLNSRKIKNFTVILFILLFMGLFTYSWYTSFADGTAIGALSGAFKTIIHELFNKLSLIQNYGIYLILIFLALILIAVIIYVLKKRQKESKRDNKSHIKEIINRNITKINAFPNNKNIFYIFASLSVIILISLAFLTGKPQTWIVGALRYLNYSVVFFSLTGLIISILYFSKNQFKIEYYAFSIVSAAILLAGILFPSFENAFNITRIFQFSFIFLSPFCVIGGIIVLKSIIKSFNRVDSW